MPEVPVNVVEVHLRNDDRKNEMPKMGGFLGKLTDWQHTINGHLFFLKVELSYAEGCLAAAKKHRALGPIAIPLIGRLKPSTLACLATDGTALPSRVPQLGSPVVPFQTSFRWLPNQSLQSDTL